MCEGVRWWAGRGLFGVRATSWGRLVKVCRRPCFRRNCPFGWKQGRRTRGGPRAGGPGTGAPEGRRNPPRSGVKSGGRGHLARRVTQGFDSTERVRHSWAGVPDRRTRDAIVVVQHAPRGGMRVEAKTWARAFPRLERRAAGKRPKPLHLAGSSSRRGLEFSGWHAACVPPAPARISWRQGFSHADLIIPESKTPPEGLRGRDPQKKGTTQGETRRTPWERPQRGRVTTHRKEGRHGERTPVH